MAKRTISQIIGDTAIYKIKSILIPHSWIVNNQTNDYGLDLNVEICINGCTTGKFFFIQSKGTSQSSSEGRISYQMLVERLLDYSRVPIPVLLLYYSETEDTFWGMWVNDVYNHLTEEQKNQKEYTIHFDKDNIIDTEYLESIGESVQNKVAYYYDVRTNSDSQNLLHQQIYKLLDTQFPDKFSYAARLASNKIFIEYHTTSRGLAVTIIDTENKIDLPPMPVEDAFLWYPNVYLEEAPLLVQIIVAILGLMHYEKGNVAIDSMLHSNELVENILPLIPQEFWFIWAQSTSIVNSEIIENVFSIAVDKNADAKEAIFLSLFLRSEQDKDVSVLLEKLMRIMIDKAVTPQARGHAYYNLANYIRRKNFHEAGILYCKAARHFPSYKEIDYWWKELAGILFITGHYYFSEQFYKRALALLKDNTEKMCDIILLLADTCLYQGKIDIAQEWLSKYFDIHYKQGKSVPFKVFLLSKSYELYKCKQTKGKFLYKLGDEWYNSGIKNQYNGEYGEAMEDFLIAWAYNTNDSEAIKNAFVMSMNAGNLNMASYILSVIKEIFGSKEINLFIKDVTEWNLPLPAKELLLTALTKKDFK